MSGIQFVSNMIHTTFIIIELNVFLCWPDASLTKGATATDSTFKPMPLEPSSLVCPTTEHFQNQVKHAKTQIKIAHTTLPH